MEPPVTMAYYGTHARDWSAPREPERDYRDSQKQRVYDAESNWTWASPNRELLRSVPPLEEIEALYEMASNDFGRTVPTVQRFSSKRWAGVYHAGRIQLTHGATFSTVLHEYAHHDTRLHQWTFTAAMLELVEWWFGPAEADLLRSKYDALNVHYTREQAEARYARNKAAHESRWERHEQKGTGYVAVRDDDNGKRYALTHNKRYITQYLNSVGVFRRRSTAEKENERYITPRYEIVEVDCEFDAYENRWIIDRDSFDMLRLGFNQN